MSKTAVIARAGVRGTPAVSSYAQRKLGGDPHDHRKHNVPYNPECRCSTVTALDIERSTRMLMTQVKE